jgi:hypothetical protein
MTTATRLTIVRQFEQVAAEHGRTLVPLTDELRLLESGLDSLGLAVVAMRLADSLGIDPFTSASPEMPVTFGDFVRIYENSRREG